MKMADICSEKVFIVAEIGNNHEGDFELAKKLIIEAANAGVDAVKFQTCNPELFISSSDQERIKRLKQFQLNNKQLIELSLLAKNLGIIFFSTPFDFQSAEFLNQIQAIFKISSGDNTFSPLIKKIANYGKPTIVSTGMLNMDGVRTLYRQWNEFGGNIKNLCLMHCISSYPAPINEVCLSAITAMKQEFPEVIIGYSDHALGIEAAILSVIAGARIIEKHFTIDKNHSDFRDHQLSANPSEMAILVSEVRRLTTIYGNGTKEIQECELSMKPLMRRSVAASENLAPGKIISNENIVWLRPGTGLQTGQEDLVLGKKLNRLVSKGELIKIEFIDNS